MKTTCLPSQRPLRQRRKERRVVVMGVVCLFNLMGKDYSTGGLPPIGSLWRISWLAFKTWTSIWAAPASKGRQQEYTCGFGLLKEWSCHPDMLLDSSSLQPRNGLEGWCLLSLLGFWDWKRAVLTPEREGLISFSSAGIELDPNGSRRKDLFLDLWTAELESPKAGEGLPIGNEGQVTPCGQVVGFPINSGMLVN